MSDQASLIALPKCQVRKVSLDLDKDITLDEWKEVGARLKMMSGAVQWWIGDWLNFGWKKYEHGKYDLALEELDYKKKTLENLRSITSLVESSRRREDLEFSFHAEIAHLDPPDQVYWLNKAVDENMTVRELREAIREMERPDSPELPTGKYRVLYCDPPWKYGDELIEGYGAAEHHYPTMTISELCDLPIHDLSDENSVLFLWVTSPMLDESFHVIESWGFEYKTSFVWDKIKHNYGHYNSVRHEFLLICTRGSCLPDIKKLHDSVISLEREKHSEKPEYFRELIDELYTKGKRIELFARETVPNWDSWGNEND